MTDDVHARHAVGRRTVGEAALLGVAAAGAFLAFLDATIVNVAFPDIRQSFPDSSISGLSWVLNAYNIVFAAFLVAAGRMCDLLGRRRVFAWGVGLFTAASAACAAAGSVPMLVAFRGVQALGAAILVPASLALVIEGFPPTRRAHGVGLWGAAAALAAGLGPPIGGAVVEASGWRLTFLINVPLGIATILLSRRVLVESRAPGRRTLPDLRGAAVLAGAIGAVTLGIVQGNDWGWTDPRVLGAFAAAVVLCAVFVERSTWHPSPIIDPALIRIRAFGAANVLTVVAGMGFYAYLLCHILYLTTIWRYDILEAGFAVMPGAIVATLAAGIVGRLADRHDPRLIIGPGALVWSAALWWYVSRVGVQPHFLADWLPGQVLSGIGVGATLPVLGTTAFAAVPGGRYATAASVVSSARQLGGVLGIAILVVIIGHPTLFSAADVLRDGWRFSAICFLAVAVGTPAIGRLRRFADEEEPARAPAGDRLPDAPPVLRPLPVAEALAASGSTGNGNGNGHRPLTTVDVLRAVPVFAGTGEATVRRVAETAESVALAAGEWLFREGDPGDALYVVRSGRLEVVKGGVGIGLVGRGEVIGELALLTEEPRSAGIRAVRDTELLCVGRERFRELIAAEPGAMLGLTRMLADRIRVSAPTEAARSPRPGVVAIVALDPTVPARAFCGGLADALRRHGSVAVPDRVDPETLEHAERDHDRVLLLAGADPDNRAACLRQADRVLALARPATPLPDAATRDALRGCDLVWAGGRPDRAQLSEWTAALAPRQQHVVRGGAAGLADGAGAIARRLAGRSVGLVLSGGGARSLAHLGVIEELHSAGIRVERVGGCSMGAFIGALHARGWDPAAIDSCVYEEFVRRNPINDYRLPSVSLVRGRKGRAMLERVFGDGIAEELEHEFFCVSCDLRTRELVEHRTGSLADALGATMCLPGILPPQIVGDRVLVDGGVLNNLPVDVLAGRDEGPIIAVDVTERFEAVRAEELLDRVARRNDRAEAAAAAAAAAPPNIKETLVRSLTLASVDTLAAARQHSALLISPAVDDVGVLEFHMIDRMREAGRAAARAALADAPPELWG